MLRSKSQRRNTIPKRNKLPHYELALPEADAIRSEALSSSGNVPLVWKCHQNLVGHSEVVSLFLLLTFCPSQMLSLAKDASGNDQHRKPWEQMHKEMPDGELRCLNVGKQILSCCGFLVIHLDDCNFSCLSWTSF